MSGSKWAVTRRPWDRGPGKGGNPRGEVDTRKMSNASIPG